MTDQDFDSFRLLQTRSYSNTKRDAVMPPFADPRDFHSFSSQSSCSFSSGQFDSSFSSSDSSYDDCYTPSRRCSSDASEVDIFPSSRNSMCSNGSNSPVNDDGMFFPMTSMTSMTGMKAEQQDLSHLYATPCHKSNADHSLMNYDYAQVSSVYGSFDSQQPFDGLPGMMFDNLPGLLFNNSTPSLQMSSSPGNFVVPSQTFISEPYRPTTPTDMSRASLGSPLAEYSQYPGSIKYFMSPREPQSRSPNSILSSASYGTLGRTPSREALESSAALHRIQETRGSRIRKQLKREGIPPNVKVVDHGVFKCEYPGCKSGHGFKRHEHLKRHQRTHVAQKVLPCKFCTRKFQIDRSDNYRAHVYLHTKNKKGSRTKYFPEAQTEYDSLSKERRADRKLGVPGEMYRIYTRKGKGNQKPSPAACATTSS